MMRALPRSTLFPYTTLFRSGRAARGGSGRCGRGGSWRGVGLLGPAGGVGVEGPDDQLGREVDGEQHEREDGGAQADVASEEDRKSTRLNSSHANISYAVFCLNDAGTPEIYTLSLHDALPIWTSGTRRIRAMRTRRLMAWRWAPWPGGRRRRRRA